MEGRASVHYDLQQGVHGEWHWRQFDEHRNLFYISKGYKRRGYAERMMQKAQGK
jgi:hypothetical protein